MATNNAINLKLSGIVTYDAAGSFTASTVTNHGVVTASTNNTVTSVAPSTSGNVLTSNGTDWTSAAATGPSSLSYVTITLTSAQIKALHGTPIQIVAAPGAGKVLCVVGPTYSKFVYGGTNVFVAGAAQTINLQYGTAFSALGTGGSIMTNALLVGTASALKGSITPIASFSTTTLTDMENAALNAYNPIATEITGNAANDNTVIFSLLYYTVTL